MPFMGFAAALIVLASDSGNYTALIAKTNKVQDAYRDCLKAQAAEKYRGKDTDELARDMIASCDTKFDSWVDAATKSSFPPQTKTELQQKLQPTRLPQAHQMIALQTGKPLKAGQLAEPAQQPTAAATKPEESGPITRHAPPPEPESVTRSAGNTAPAAPLGPCGGISVPTNPSALVCR